MMENKKIISPIMEFDHKETFIKAATALVKSLSNGGKLYDALYDFGIDIANYVDPTYEFLEDFITDNYDDEHGIIMDMLIDLAQYGVVEIDDIDDGGIIKKITTVEEIYDFFFKECK